MRRLGPPAVALALATFSLAPPAAGAWPNEAAGMVPGGQPLLAASPLPSGSPGGVVGASPPPTSASLVPNPTLAPVVVRPVPSVLPSPALHRWEPPVWEPEQAGPGVPVGYHPAAQALVFLPVSGVVPLLIEQASPPRLTLRLPVGTRWAPGLPGQRWPVAGPLGPVLAVEVAPDGRDLVVRFAQRVPPYALVPAADGRLALAFGGAQRAWLGLSASPRPIPSPRPPSPTPTPSVLILPDPVPWRSDRPTSRPAPTWSPAPLPTEMVPAPSLAPAPSTGPVFGPTPVPSPRARVAVTPPPLPDLPRTEEGGPAPLWGRRLSLDGELAMSLQEALPADGFEASAGLVPGGRLRWEGLLSPQVGLLAQLSGQGVKYEEQALARLGLAGVNLRDQYELGMHLLGRLPLGPWELVAFPGLMVRGTVAELQAGRPGAPQSIRSGAYRHSSLLAYGAGLGLGWGWRWGEVLALRTEAQGYGLLGGLSDPSGGLRPYPLLGARGELSLVLRLGPVEAHGGYVVVEEVAAGKDTPSTLTRRWSGPTLGLSWWY